MCKALSFVRHLCFLHIVKTIIIPDEYLLTLDSTRDKYSIVQCNQKGVENCKPVTVNAELFKSLIDRKGSSVKLMEGSDIQLKVDQGKGEIGVNGNACF